MKNLFAIIFSLLTISAFSQDNVIDDKINYIKEQSVEGGELDFTKNLEGQTMFLYDGIAYSKKDFALFLWGAKVKTLGIKSKTEAIKLREDIAGKELTEPEKKALSNGFAYDPENKQ